MYKLSVSHFGASNAYKEVHVFVNDTQIEVVTYDAEGNRLLQKVEVNPGLIETHYPKTDGSGDLEIYVEEENGYDIKCGDKKFYSSTATEDIRAEVKIVTEPPAAGTADNVISIILAE